jgi:hypothetical protein
MLLGAALLFFPFSCSEALSHGKEAARSAALRKDMVAKIAHARSLLQDGDLVLRTGNDFISLTLRQFSMQDKTYSHCGLVRITGGKIYVYHAIGGEDNPDARLRRDSFAAFCDPEHNLGFGVFRYRMTAGARQRLDSLVDLYYRERIPFDMKFDLSTDSSFYCAEFVYKVVERATRDPHYLPVSHIGSFTYEAIDNLFVNAHARPVYRAVFTPGADR